MEKRTLTVSIILFFCFYFVLYWATGIPGELYSVGEKTSWGYEFCFEFNTRFLCLLGYFASLRIHIFLGGFMTLLLVLFLMSLITSILIQMIIKISQNLRNRRQCSKCVDDDYLKH